MFDSVITTRIQQMLKTNTVTKHTSIINKQ